MERITHGELVRGIDVDPATRCVHWRSPLDIIAIKFRCCEEWFPCYECHRELADHDAEIWNANEFDSEAVLCGECGYRLTINKYLTCDAACVSCGAAFNPGCANHYHLYFQI